MTEQTNRIIETIAANHGVSSEEVIRDMQEAIRAGMASPDPHAQSLWAMMCPDGKEPDLDTFFAFMMQKMINPALDESFEV